MLATAGRLMFVAVTILVAGTGCAMCSSCDDYTYPSQSGIWQRLDPVHGRVGSIFTPEVWAGDGEYVEGSIDGTAPELLAPDGDLAPMDGLMGDETIGGDSPSPDDAVPEPADSSSLPEASVLQIPGIQVR